MSAALLSTHGLVARYGDFRALYGDRFRDRSGRGRGADRGERRRQVDAAEVDHGAAARRPEMVQLDGRPVGGAQAAQHGGRGASPSYRKGRRLFTGMSVEDNLRVAIDHAARPRERGWTLERVFGLFPMLREKRATPVQSLSGGQQQMVAIGRALLNQPRLLLCDEISLGLAPKVVREIYRVDPVDLADWNRHRAGRAGCRRSPSPPRTGSIACWKVASP